MIGVCNNLSKQGRFAQVPQNGAVLINLVIHLRGHLTCAILHLVWPEVFFWSDRGFSQCGLLSVLLPCALDGHPVSASWWKGSGGWILLGQTCLKYPSFVFPWHPKLGLCGDFIPNFGDFFPTFLVQVASSIFCCQTITDWTMSNLDEKNAGNWIINPRSSRVFGDYKPCFFDQPGLIMA